MLFVISLLIIILLHELSHLIVAKWCKCKVEIFSIGFGRPLIQKKIKETIYQICPILLGGYCKLKGEIAQTRSKYAFCNLPYRKKLYISIAGIVINVLTGLLALIIGHLFFNFSLLYFGVMSIFMGVLNGLPIPSLDGSYPILVLLEKYLGKKKAYKCIEKINRIGFIAIMILNVLCIPFVIIYLIKS